MLAYMDTLMCWSNDVQDFEWVVHSLVIKPLLRESIYVHHMQIFRFLVWYLVVLQVMSIGDQLDYYSVYTDHYTLF